MTTIVRPLSRVEKVETTALEETETDELEVLVLVEEIVTVERPPVDDDSEEVEEATVSVVEGDGEASVDEVVSVVEVSDVAVSSVVVELEEDVVSEVVGVEDVVSEVGVVSVVDEEVVEVVSDSA